MVPMWKNVHLVSETQHLVHCTWNTVLKKWAKDDTQESEQPGEDWEKEKTGTEMEPRERRERETHLSTSLMQRSRLTDANGSLPLWPFTLHQHFRESAEIKSVTNRATWLLLYSKLLDSSPFVWIQSALYFLTKRNALSELYIYWMYSTSLNPAHYINWD